MGWRSVFISTPTVDLNGAVRLKIAEDSEFKVNSRRVSRTSTLDGGACIVDGGFCDADRTFTVNYWDLSSDDEAKLWDIFQGYSLIGFSNEEGFFSAAMDTANLRSGSGSLTILYKERLSA